MKSPSRNPGSSDGPAQGVLTRPRTMGRGFDLETRGAPPCRHGCRIRRAGWSTSRGRELFHRSSRSAASSPKSPSSDAPARPGGNARPPIARSDHRPAWSACRLGTGRAPQDGIHEGRRPGTTGCPRQGNAGVRPPHARAPDRGWSADTAPSLRMSCSSGATLDQPRGTSGASWASRTLRCRRTPAASSWAKTAVRLCQRAHRVDRAATSKVFPLRTCSRMLSAACRGV